MELTILLAPVIVPVAAMYIVRRLGWRSTWSQLSAAAILCAALGAFIGSAASAMASAVRPEIAMLRGAGAGLLFGLAVGILYLAIAVLRRRVAQKTD